MMRSLLLAKLILLSLLSSIAISQTADGNLSYILLISSENPPTNLQTAYIGQDFSLVFAPNNLDYSALGAALFPDLPGDYYIINAKQDNKSESFPFPHKMLGDIVVFKSESKDMSELAKYGWGLTRLTPHPKVEFTQSDNSLPVVTSVDSDIEDMVSVITPQTTRQVIAELSAIPTRYSITEGCRQAEQYIFNKFSEFGLNTSYFTYVYSDVTMRNVIGEITGQSFPDSIIIICGHLDCTSESRLTLAPGAEDNASGACAVIEAARAFSGYQTDLTVRFIAFSGEEQGLIGSDMYAQYVQNQQQTVAAVINADMVGYSGSYSLDMHIFSDRQSWSLGALGAQIMADYSNLDTIPHYLSYPQSGSDHYSFASRGYKAIFFIDAWQGYDWYPFYHTTADTLGNLNLNQQSEISQVVTAMTATLVRPHFNSRFEPGDANGSGIVNGIDVVYLVSYFKGGPPPPDPILRADANGNCAVNGIDVVYLVSYLKGGPAPFRGNCK
jgi:hypothetical protein